MTTILAIWLGLRRALSTFLGWAGRHPREGVIIALCVALAALWWHSGRLRDQRDAARSEITAMTEASRRLIEQGKRLETESRRLSNATDKTDAAVRIVFRDRLLRLPAASSVCAAAQDHVPGGTDGPRDDPGLSEGVIISRSDAGVCANNTSRLQAVREWALGVQALQDE